MSNNSSLRRKDLYAGRDALTGAALCVAVALALSLPIPPNGHGRHPRHGCWPVLRKVVVQAQTVCKTGRTHKAKFNVWVHRLGYVLQGKMETQGAIGKDAQC